MLIAHISDSHIELPEPEEAGRIRDFERVVSHIKQLDPAPDMIVHTGDITNSNELSEYKKVREILSPLSQKLLIIPGNKDQSDKVRMVFGEAAGEGCGPVNYTVDAGPVTLIMLDTLSPTSNKGAVCAERAEWLDMQLNAISGPVAIFMHHPTYEMPELPEPFQFESREMADRFNAIITSHKHVTGIFCGHSHRNTMGFIGSVPAMTLTSMSLDRRKGIYPPELEGKPLYQLIEFDEDGGFETRLQACD